MKRLNALTFKQLRSLRAVTDLRAISRAADLLGLTPPAVHSQLKALEENFGCAMLYREGPQAFSPTPEGQALLAAFDRAEAGLELALHRITALQKGMAGTVVLAVVSTAKYFAPTLVAQLKRDLPDVEVILKVGNRGDIVEALRDGALDLALTGRPPRDPPVVAEAIGDNPHLLIAPPDHPLAQVGAIEAKDILSQPFIAREQGSGTRILAERYLRGLSDDPVELVEMPSNETIKQSVMAGLGLAILSQHTVSEELRSGRLVALQAEKLPIVRQWYLIHPADQPPTGAVRNVHDHILESIGPIFERNLARTPL